MKQIECDQKRYFRATSINVVYILGAFRWRDNTPYGLAFTRQLDLIFGVVESGIGDADKKYCPINRWEYRSWSMIQ